MDGAGFLDRLRTEGARTAEIARSADPDAPVPGLDWTVREVVVHTGAVHRWCADLVGHRRQADENGGSAAFHPAGSVADLVDWFVEGVAALVATLTDTPDDVQVWGFGRAVPARAFWSRRQAHETAVHRADVEAGAGRTPTAVDADFAQDGLDEITRFARGFRCAPGPARRLALAATDGDDRLVTFEGGRITTTRESAADADASVTGTSSDLYLWAWNRPSAATVTGEPAVVDRWRQVRIS